jgi:hypothetical protein
MPCIKNLMIKREESKVEFEFKEIFLVEDIYIIASFELNLHHVVSNNNLK